MISKTEPNSRNFYILFFVFLVSVLADFGSTVMIPSFISLESNPLALFIPLNPIFLIFMVKVFFIWVVYATFKYHKKINKTDFSRYFYITLIIMLTGIQFFAAVSNVLTIHHATGVINSELGTNYSIWEVPASEVELRTPDTSEMLSSYFFLVFLVLYYPLGLSLLSFWVWLKLWT